MDDEQVLIIIKPDGMVKLLAGVVLGRFLELGLSLVAIKTVRVSERLASRHYAPLREKPFYKQIVEYLCGRYHNGSEVIAFVLAGKDAIKKCRRLAGDTHPEKADPRSIRGAYGRITREGLYENVVHVSSSRPEARREINLWFSQKELRQDGSKTK